jgi:hypothetical protein
LVDHPAQEAWASDRDHKGDVQVDADTLLAEVVRVAPALHKAGTFSPRALEAVLRHASEKPLYHSIETGSGASTLLLSHLSKDHTVFALDAGTDSIRSVRNSPLFREATVTFVEGPTQRTLPLYTFSHSLQLALIDGPHGYPFPDLEYYYVYPHLEPGALLIIDDIQIPTITNLFDFLAAEDMFDLQEVVDTTAFFRRTDAPTFSPCGDGWWLQGYNRRAFESIRADVQPGPSPEPIDHPTRYHIDQFGPFTDPLRITRIQIPHDEVLAIAGWALDDRSRRPAAAVDLVLDGVSYRTTVRVPRADVAAALGDPAYFRSGFNTHLARGVLKPGRHELEMRILAAGACEYYSAARIQFEAV